MPQLNGTLVLSTSDTIKGNIVLAPLSNPPNDAVLEFQNQGAIAVVMEGFPDAFGVGELQTILAAQPIPTIPLYNLGESDYIALSSALSTNWSQGVQVTVVVQDLNRWISDSVLKMTLALFIFDGALCVAVIILAIIQLVKSCRTLGFIFNIPQASFILLIIAAVGNFFVTPMLYGPINLMNGNAATVFSSFGIPFILTTALLIAFYWHESYRELTINLNMKLHRMKILAIVLSISCFVVVFGLSFLRMALRASVPEIYYASLVASIVFTAVVCLPIAAFYLASGIRINKLITDNVNAGTRWVSPKKATAIMFVSASLLLVFAVVILIGLHINFIRPVGLVLYLFLIILFQNALSVTFIFGFSYTKLTSKAKPTHYQMELADSGNVDQQQKGDTATA
jgi:hypothetical protein